MFGKFLTTVAMAAGLVLMGGAVASFAGLPLWTAPLVGIVFVAAIARLNDE